MPIDPTLNELSGQQQPPQLLPPQQLGGGLDQLAQSQMTHQPKQPNPVGNTIKGFLDYANQYAPPPEPAPWDSKINQAITRQDPRYVPSTPSPQHNWQSWMENSLNFIPLFGNTLKLNRVPHDGKWFSKDKFDLMHQETGDKRGSVWLTFDPKKKNLKVNYFESNTDKLFRTDPATGKLIDARKFALGKNPLDALVELKSALPDAFNHYPDMQTLEFYGVGGAKKEQGVTANLKFKVWKTPDGNVEWEKIKHETRDRNPSPPPPSPEPSNPEPQTSFPQEQMRQRQLEERATRQNETWDQMRQRQDAEWAALMQRLFGNR